MKKSLLLLIVICFCHAFAFSQLVVVKSAKTNSVVTTVNELPSDFKPTKEERILFQGEGVFVYGEVKKLKTENNTNFVQINLTRIINTDKKKKIQFDGISAGYGADGNTIQPEGGFKVQTEKLTSGLNKLSTSNTFLIPSDVEIKPLLLNVRFK